MDAPRCCRTHLLELRAQSSSALSAEEVLELAQLHANSDGDAWMILVGGEHGGRMRPDYEGTRPGPYLAGHCSLHWIGRVYSRLVRFFGRDKVIVIAQLQETLQWLREASKDEESAQRLAGRSALLPMLQQQLSELLESCADLIADGGAHYDGPEVNPATVLEVLRGERPRSISSRVRSVLLLLVSHGHAHPAGPGTSHHEWYMHLPYPVPESDATLYDVVSHQGFHEVDPHPDWDWGAPKHRWRLYSQMLFQAYHSMLEQSPHRRLVIFHQFCLSGGVVEFMRRPSYRTYFGTQSWPVFAVTTAGSFEPALGTFIGLWSDELRKALEAGGSKSLGEVQALAEARYWADNAGIKVQNDRILAGELPTEASTVGTVGCEAGFDGRSQQLMMALPVREIVNETNETNEMNTVKRTPKRSLGE
ncbi:unnamed protein product [Cladocopium goreaui]|uniref:Pentatricopeptide repeat-containing protein, chloroplastic n=1 Tax=Cladocopium goreaui TaxID=2562237 RepID=A0A9P1DAH8_9DINO|nr:unnamed protein product [Cladocopium goreaui]